MKSYDLSFSVSLSTGPDYSKTYPFKFNVTEKLPKDVDALRHIKLRLAEEVNRAFATLDEVIDNISDEKKESQDPLVDAIPF
jgi:hypothetical protein